MFLPLAVFIICCGQKAPKTDFSLFERKEYVKEGVTLPYRILWPENMQKGTQYPLFLFLHGMGMRGTDNEKQLTRGAFLFVKPENRRDYPCIALYPQAPTTSAFVMLKSDGRESPGGFASHARGETKDAKIELTPYGNMVMELVHQLIDKGVVDIKRIYVAGSSMGAYTTYKLLADYPDLFAAAAPMAGATDLSTLKAWAGKVPVWIVHGDEDKAVPPDMDRKVAEVLREMGAEHKYSEYKGVKHNSWDNAFAEPDFMQWFFSHAKK